MCCAGGCARRGGATAAGRRPHHVDDRHRHRGAIAGCPHRRAPGAAPGRTTRADLPDIEWVFTHGGGALPLLADRMELFRTVFTGEDDPDGAVPHQLRRLWFDIAGTPFPHQVPAAVAAFGTGRLLYGSDYCWTPAHGVDAQLASIDQARQPANDTWRALTTPQRHPAAASPPLGPARRPRLGPNGFGPSRDAVLPR